MTLTLRIDPRTTKLILAVIYALGLSMSAALTPWDRSLLSGWNVGQAGMLFSLAGVLGYDLWRNQKQFRFRLPEVWFYLNFANLIVLFAIIGDYKMVALFIIFPFVAVTHEPRRNRFLPVSLDRFMQGTLTVITVASSLVIGGLWMGL